MKIFLFFLFHFYLFSQMGIYEQLIRNIPECNPDDVKLNNLLHSGQFTEVYLASIVKVKDMSPGAVVVAKRSKGEKLL